MSAKESASPIEKTIVTQVFRAWHSVDLRLDLVGPKKLPSSHCINRNRDHEKRDFADADFRWAVPCQHKKHPRKENHGVAIRKLPASGVSMTPKNERQEGHRNPCGDLVFSTLAKKET